MSSAIGTIKGGRIKVSWVLVAAALVLAAAGSFTVMRIVTTQGASPSVDTTTGLGANASSGAASTPIDVVPREPTEYLVVYARPAEDPRLDATVYVTAIDARSRTSGQNIQLGKFTGVELAPSNSPAFNTTPRLIVQDTAGRGYLLHLGEQGATTADQFQAGRLPRAVSVGDIAFRQEGHQLVARNTGGQVVASYQLPQPLPPAADDPITRTFAVIDTESRVVSAVVPIPGGRLLAFVENVSNSVLVDLTTGSRADLVGFSGLLAATLAEDGFVYAAGRNVSSGDGELEVLKLDPATLATVGRQAMGFKSFEAGDHLIDGWSFLATPDGKVYLYLPRIDLKTGVTESLLYQVDQETAATTVVPLPPALGLDATIGVDGKIYFSGGPAENRVSIYDPATGELQEDVPWLRAPEGTYVKGVVVR